MYIRKYKIRVPCFESPRVFSDDVRRRAPKIFAEVPKVSAEQLVSFLFSKN